MANEFNKWTGTNSDSDWDAAGNWSEALAPAATMHLLIGQSDATIDTDLETVGNGLDFADLTVGPEFGGSLGTATNKLYVGSMDFLRFDGAKCKQCWIAVDAADDITETYVLNARYNENALHLFSGTFTRVHVRRAGMCRIGAAATVPDAIVGWTNSRASDSHVYIEAGATVSHVLQTGGVVDNYTGFTVAGDHITIGGGVFNHAVTVTADASIQTINVWGGQFNFASKGGTLTTANVYGGVLNLNCGEGWQRTITTLNRYGGVTDIRGKGANTVITTNNAFGGELLVDSVAG